MKKLLAILGVISLFLCAAEISFDAGLRVLEGAGIVLVAVAA